MPPTSILPGAYNIAAILLPGGQSPLPEVLIVGAQQPLLQQLLLPPRCCSAAAVAGKYIQGATLTQAGATIAQRLVGQVRSLAFSQQQIVQSMPVLIYSSSNINCWQQGALLRPSRRQHCRASKALASRPVKGHGGLAETLLPVPALVSMLWWGRRH